MAETDYQICLMMVEKLAAQGMITSEEKDRISALLKKEFEPEITLLLDSSPLLFIPHV